MQKDILFMCISSVALINGMKIVDEINNNNPKYDSAIIHTLSQHPNLVGTGAAEEDMFSHQSPLITAIHSKDYLRNIEKHPSIMLSAITNTILPALYPNTYSRAYFDDMLKQCAVTTVATKLLIDQINEQKPLPHYTISLGEAYSFAGHAQGNHGDAYAVIPTAALYALNTTLIKRILILDEKATTNTHDYYHYGNGSILLSSLFGDKIITPDKLLNTNLWSFLSARPAVSSEVLTKEELVEGCTINLAFYNINIEDNNHTKNKRTHNIFSLFYRSIPTVFILSGDKNNHQETTYYIIDYIINTAKAAALRPVVFQYDREGNEIEKEQL